MTLPITWKHIWMSTRFWLAHGRARGDSQAMPHIILDYSANLDPMLDMHGLCLALKDAAAATGIFPAAGIRVRAHAATHSVVADGDPKHGYIDISIRLAAGRTQAQKAQAQVWASALTFGGVPLK